MLIQVLGQVGVFHGDESTRISASQKRIVAVLVAAGPGGLTSDAFADQVWGDDLPREWESAVRMAISRLRRALPPGTIVRDGGRYRLELGHRDVDAWLLQADLADSDLGDDHLLLALLSGTPYSELEPASLLRTSAHAVGAARIDLIDRLSEAEAPAPSQRVLGAVRSHQLAEPYDEALMAAAARLHMKAGHHGAALQLLQAGMGRLIDEVGVEVGGELIDLTKQLESTSAETSGPGVEVIEDPQRTVGRHLAEPDHAEVDRLVGLGLDDWSALDGGLLIVGDAGSGKSTVARRFAARSIEDGHHVIWLTANRHATASYGPFLATLPILRSVIDPLVLDGGTAATRSAAWTQALAAIEQDFAGRPIDLFVDDAQWLDSHSQLFVEYLACCDVEPPLRVTVIGRADSAAVGWPRQRRQLVRGGLRSVTVGDFTAEELSDVIGREHPQSTSAQRSDLARILLERRTGLPVVARALIANSEPATLISGRTHLDDIDAVWTETTSPASRDVAAVAAVIGIGFRVGRVAELAGLSVPEVTAAVDELLDLGMVVAEERPDEFSFRHVLIHQAFGSVLEASHRRALHGRAAELIEDVHERSRHLVAGLPDVAIEDAAIALEASCRSHLSHGSFRAAVEGYHHLAGLTDGELGAHTLADFASAIESNGGDGHPVRQQAVAAAVRTGDHALSLSIALAGVVETERVDGDTRRVALLEQLDVSSLNSADSFAHSAALIRQLGFVGRHDEALARSQSDVARAETTDQAYGAWVAASPTLMSLPPADWPSMPETHGGELLESAGLRSRFHHFSAVRSLIDGTLDEAKDHLAQFGASEFTRSDPLSEWQLLLVEGLVEFLEGRSVSANVIADAAFDHARRHGLTNAFNTRAAQLFAQHWTWGQHGLLIDVIESAAPDVAESLLAQTARAVAMATDPDRRQEVDASITAIIERLKNERLSDGVAIAVLVASTVTAETEDAVRSTLKTVLEPFRGTSAVVGAGVTNLGPVTRSLAHLAVDDADRTDLLRNAIDEADRSGLLVWSVRCRLDLADATGDTSHRDEARVLAAGTDMVAYLL